MKKLFTLVVLSFLLTGTASAAGSYSNTTKPTISGNTIVGQTLQSSPGTWTPTPGSYKYNWLRCSSNALSSCVSITGGPINQYTLTASYTLTATDVGKYMRAVVLATGIIGDINYREANSEFSDATAIVTPDAGTPGSDLGPGTPGSADLGPGTPGSDDLGPGTPGVADKLGKPGEIDTVDDVLNVINKITNWMFTIFIATAVIFILLAAFKYLTSGGGEETAKAHKMLLYSAVAIAVAILAKGVVNIVQSILKV